MSFRVNNSEIEGQHPLLTVTPVILLKTRVFLAVVLSICTGLLFALALKWSNKLYNQFLFAPVPNEAVGTHYKVDTQAGQQFTVPKRILNGMNIFTFRLLKYTFDASTQCYQPLEFETEGKEFKKILEDKEKVQRDMKFEYYGSCQLHIPVESAPNFFFENLTGPFNILQYFAIAVWFAEGVIQQPILILAFTALAICVNYLLYRRSRHLLQQLANIHTIVQVRSGDQLKKVNGADIVPGDIIILEEGQQLNCDCAIIQGDVMVNEATLTGESVPIPKNSVPDHSAKFNFEQLNQHCLFEGTKLVQVNLSIECQAIVLRTGFSSLRGQYFRNVLFPAPPSKRFYIQAAKFILIFALLIIIVYCANLQNYIDVGFGTKILVLRFLDNIVWSIPPSMPIMFSICKTASLARLGQAGVMGSNADKIEEAGRVDTCCFDKTGTLTTLGLKAQTVWTPSHDLDVYAKYIMGCCHHLLYIKGELLGDPLEVEMLNYVGWEIKFDGYTHFAVTNGKDINFEITKIFDFSSARQMMSVIATDGKKHYLFSKGSPEMVNFNAKTKKQNILDEVHQYASNGFRVLGLAYKELNANELELQREQLETQLEFTGIFVLENPLKPDTGDVLKLLKEANLDIKVISGDSPLTTVYCGRVSNIIGMKDEVILLHFDPNTQKAVITENNVETEYEDLQKNPAILETIIDRPIQTAMTGKFLEYMSRFLTVKQEDEQPKQIDTSVNQTNQVFTDTNQLDFGDQRMSDILMKLIAKTRVFARQKPDQKKQIVYLLQKMGRQVLMCGDGANDCSAIAQAHIGISFSESDASYTSPFSSKTTSLSCVIKVLAQGKAAIMIIIEVFQYTLSVNGIKFLSVILMLMEAETYADFQFTFVGFITTIPLMIAYCFSRPCTKLSPYIPLDDQFTYQNFLKVYNVILWGSVGLLILYGILRGMDRTYVHLTSDDEYNRSGTMNSVMFVSVSFYFMTFGLICYVSAPFKRHYYQNRALSLWTLVWLIIAIMQILVPSTGKWCKIIDYRDDTYEGFEWVIIAVLSVSSLIGYITQTLLHHYVPSSIKIQH